MIFKGRGVLQQTGKNSMSQYGYSSPKISNISPITINGSGLGSSTINLGSGLGISGLSAQSISALNPVTFTISDPNVKRYEIIESKQDLVVLSATWSRLREANQAHFISSMLENRLFEEVTKEDIETAAKIRDYYDKKIMVLKLKNIEMSNFRKSLIELLAGDGTKFKEDLVPLAYRLPEFYKYDVEFEKLLFAVKREVDMDIGEVHKAATLTLVKEFTVTSRKFGKRKEYWFVDAETNNLVTFHVETSNPLISLMDKLVRNPTIFVDAVFKKRERDGYEYMKMRNVKFG